MNFQKKKLVLSMKKIAVLEGWVIKKLIAVTNLISAINPYLLDFLNDTISKDKFDKHIFNASLFASFNAYTDLLNKTITLENKLKILERNKFVDLATNKHEMGKRLSSVNTHLIPSIVFDNQSINRIYESNALMNAIKFQHVSLGPKIDGEKNLSSGNKINETIF
jgi:hypothetical protein